MGNDLLVKKNRFPSLREIFNISSATSMIAGPCSVESVEQMELVAQALIKNKVRFIRGGAFKPRKSPYDFQGLGDKGLEILDYIRRKYSLLAVSEILDVRDLEKATQYLDVIQIGSRNMQNTTLLKEVGKLRHPVLLKRGMMSTVEEFLLAAEFIISGGNNTLFLCERGIRTFEDKTRFTLDISCVAIIKKETSLSVIVDLSHSLGRKDIVVSVGKAVIALGADGIMLEVHNAPEEALSDSRQQLSLQEFQEFMDAVTM